MVQITHPTDNQTLLHTEGTCLQDEACTGFKNVRVKDSLFHILYIQCDDKAQDEQHKPKHTERFCELSSAMETSSVMQTRVCTIFRGESSCFRTCSCINIITITPFPQRDRNVSSFGRSGLISALAFCLSWIYSFFSPLFITSDTFICSTVVHPSSFLIDVSPSEISDWKNEENWRKSRSLL